MDHYQQTRVTFGGPAGLNQQRQTKNSRKQDVIIAYVDPDTRHGDAC
jgi:hypothetical protein